MLCCFNSRKNKVVPDGNATKERKETPRESLNKADKDSKERDMVRSQTPEQNSPVVPEASRGIQNRGVSPPEPKSVEPQKTTESAPSTITQDQPAVITTEQKGKEMLVEETMELLKPQKDVEGVVEQRVEEKLGAMAFVSAEKRPMRESENEAGIEEPVAEGVRRQKTSGMNRYSSVANIPMLVFGTEDITDRERDVITRLSRARQEHLMVTGQLNENAHITVILERTRKALNKDLKLAQGDEPNIDQMTLESLTELEDGLSGALKRLEQFKMKTSELFEHTQQALTRASLFQDEVTNSVCKIEEHHTTVNAKDDELKKDIEKCHIKKETLTKELDRDEAGVTLARIKRVDRDLSKASELSLAFENLRKLIEDGLREIKNRIQSDVQENIERASAFKEWSKESDLWYTNIHRSLVSIKSKVTETKKLKTESTLIEKRGTKSVNEEPESGYPPGSDNDVPPFVGNPHQGSAESKACAPEDVVGEISLPLNESLTVSHVELEHKTGSSDKITKSNQDSEEILHNTELVEPLESATYNLPEIKSEVQSTALMPLKIPTMPMFVVASEEETSKERVAAQQTMKLLSELDGYRTSDDTCMRTINLSTRCRRALESDINDLKSALAPLERDPPGEVSDIHIIKSIIRSADKKFISFRKMVETAKRDVMQGIRGKQELTERAAELRVLLSEELEQVKQELASETDKLQEKQKLHETLKSQIDTEGESHASALAQSELGLREVEDHVLAQQNRVEFLKGRLHEIDNRLTPQLAQSRNKDDEMNPVLDEFRASFEGYLSVLRELKDKIRTLPATEDIKQETDFDKEFMAAVGGFIKDEEDGVEPAATKANGEGGLTIGPAVKD